MGAELFSEYAVFRNAIKYHDKILAKLSVRPSWSIEGNAFPSVMCFPNLVTVEQLLAPTATSRIHEPEISQTICTALQLALVDLLRSWSVQPVATIGHSSGKIFKSITLNVSNMSAPGEIAAAYAAGAHTAAEAVVLAYLRGQVVTLIHQDGLMLAVGLNPEGVLPYLKGKESDVTIAAVNSSESITLSGDAAAIMDILAKLDGDKLFARLLRTGGKAYHSHHMAAFGEKYERSCRECIHEISHEIECEPLETGAFWQSSVIPDSDNSGSLFGPSYWRKNLESPVYFYNAVNAMLEKKDLNLDLLVEIGPHPALSGPLKQIRNRREQESGSPLPPCLPTLKRGEKALRSMLTLGGHLFIRNTSINLAAVNAMDQYQNGKLQLARGSLCIDLPNYQYHYGPIIYHENRTNKELRLRKHLRHDLLGARQPGSAKGRPSWRNILRLKDVPWLEDHKVLLITISL